MKPGQAAIFGSSDRHSLRAADGVTAASFLEFPHSGGLHDSEGSAHGMNPRSVTQIHFSARISSRAAFTALMMF